MNNSDKIRNMQDTINEILVQQTILTYKCHATESLLFEVISECFPDKASLVFTNYIIQMENDINDSLDSLEDVLLDHDPAFLLHKKFEFRSYLEQLKRHDLFQSNS
ncbi:hypothetical protein [Parabacteroides provencensis]|uniref:hypothetical protein n=1 Tax=Parabacteroides provencensis TaxID=1944636 RepID=UPI000C146C2F|nr:hypothetical protein [Parabacteroides provencensis]